MVPPGADRAATPKSAATEAEPSAAEYEAVLADHRRLVRELDVLLNGDRAAEQASLCDIVSQLKVEIPGVLGAIREVRQDFDVSDMQRMAVNVMHASGSLPRDLRRKAAHAVLALKAIFDAATNPGDDQ
jgi:hypothetical protein